MCDDTLPVACVGWLCYNGDRIAVTPAVYSMSGAPTLAGMCPAPFLLTYGPITLHRWDLRSNDCDRRLRCLGLNLEW